MTRIRAAARVVGLAAGLIVVAALSPLTNAQELKQWTEGPGDLGLGYPVPIPVATPLPFDGFRSYDGLLARHAQLAMDSGLLERSVIGQTVHGRDIPAWRLGDPDDRTRFGLAEPAMMIQGGIHAREWQSPEVVTGVMEWLIERRGDNGFHDYLLENTNVVVIPVLNVDGFLQTQRFPTRNFIGADPTSPDTWPRDGRMTRKNLRGRDEDLLTVSDHLEGIDLNRNSEPFWATSGSSSSSSIALTHHGTAPFSEPESQAMVAAVGLAPADRLRIYTDVHSFGRVFFSEQTANLRKNIITANLLADMANHHAALPGGVRYFNSPSRAGGGIGSTDEYFSVTYGVPSWTLEIEPSGGGVEYGGLGSNSHDGFILPESEVRRVRENLAQSFLVAWYHQAGPPAVAALRITDVATGAVVHDLEWDVVDAEARDLHETAHRPLLPDREYALWIAFDKPMRWREAGEVVALPGQLEFGLRVVSDLRSDDQVLPTDDGEPLWLDMPGGAGVGYLHYRDDAFERLFTLSSTGFVPGTATFDLQVADMVGQRTDADPATIADWSSVGNWVRYESSNGTEGDTGGSDQTLAVGLANAAAAPFLVVPGSTAAYFDAARAGEGFLLEILENDVAVVYWFTYDDDGGQRWYTGTGVIRGNEVVFTDLVGASGGVFGTAFDPAAVQLEPVGRLSIVFTGCDEAALRFASGTRVHRQTLQRLTTADGLACEPAGDAKGSGSGLTGSWYAPERAGEGFVIQALDDGRALIYWFTWTPDGQQAWFFGDALLGADGRVVIDDAFMTSGARFGDAFDPTDVVLERWGSMSFEFACGTAEMSYAAAAAGYGEGANSLVRLTRPTTTSDCP